MWCLETFPGRDALKAMMRSTLGAWVVGMALGQSTSSMSMENQGEPQNVGEGAVDADNPPSLLIVTVNGKGHSEVMAANS